MKLTRREWLKAGAALAASPPFISFGQPQSLESIAEAVHHEMWSRFVDQRFDVLLHYAGLSGEVVYPTAEDCERCRPNGMAWSTPIEDGPFYGGLYLAGLCGRWRHRRDDEARQKVSRIAGGLMTLEAAGGTPGFVARGVGADGRSHYPASSEDQVFPWFFGLWSYLSTDIPPEEERQKITRKLVDVVKALKHHQWRVPCDPPEFGYRGGFAGEKSKDAARLLFMLRAIHQLTGDDAWLAEYHDHLHERLVVAKKTGMKKSRQELCAEGFDYFSPKGHTIVWTRSTCQAALRGLLDMETDPAVKASYQAGLDASAGRAVAIVQHGFGYERSNTLHFDPDWRFLNEAWKPQADCDEAIALASSQLALWAEHNPRSPYEDETMREPLFAAWIIVLSGNKTLIAAHRTKIESLLQRYDWAGLHTAACFVVTNLCYGLLAEFHPG